MKQYLKNNWMSFALLALALVFGLWLSPRLPDQVPSHFNIEGQPDAYGSKIYSLIFLPMVNIALLFLLPGLIKISPNSYQMENSQKGLARINLAITFLLCGFYVVILQNAIQPTNFPIPINLAFIISIFMIFLGNYLGKVERNFFAGIRTPWTLASERNWLATHRFAAKTFVIFGIISTIASFANEKLYWTTGLILLASLTSGLYSFLFYSKYEKSV